MATYQKFDSLPAALWTGSINIGSDTFKVMLTNTQPSGSNDSVFADLTEITAQNNYSAGGGTVANASGSHDSNGLYSVVGDDHVFTASGGSFGPFQWAVLYSSTSNDLIGFWDYGSAVTVLTGETFTVDFAATINTTQ